MAALYASPDGTAVICLANVPSAPEGASYNSTPYEVRGWCVFEYFSAQIVVGSDSHTASTHIASTPKLLDVMGGPPPEVSISPSPEEFASHLDQAKFTGKGDHELVKMMYTDFWIAYGVGRRAQLTLLETRRAAEARRRAMRRTVLMGAGTPALAASVFFVVGVALDIPGLYALAGAIALSAFAMMMLAILPDESRVIELFSRVFFVFGLTSTSLSTYATWLNIRRCSDSDHIRCPLVASAASGIMTAVDGTAVAASIVHGLRNSLPSRLALLRIWTFFRFLLVAPMLITIAARLASAALDSTFTADLDFLLPILGLVGMLCLSAACSPANRRRAQAWVGQLRGIPSVVLVGWLPAVIGLAAALVGGTTNNSPLTSGALVILVPALLTMLLQIESEISKTAAQRLCVSICALAVVTAVLSAMFGEMRVRECFEQPRHRYKCAHFSYLGLSAVCFWTAIHMAWIVRALTRNLMPTSRALQLIWLSLRVTLSFGFLSYVGGEISMPLIRDGQFKFTYLAAGGSLWSSSVRHQPIGSVFMRSLTGLMMACAKTQRRIVFRQRSLRSSAVATRRS
jgi:hypothetical protein